MEIEIKCEDERMIYGTYYKNPNAKKLLVINSALGIKQSFYKEFGEYLKQRGFSVFTWDPRGIGKSALPNPKNDPAKMSDWGKLDFEAVLKYLERFHRFDEMELIGHSAGGHLAGLAPSFKHFKKVNLISSGTCTWKLYPLREQPKMLLSWLVAVPALVQVFGYVPAKFGVGQHVPKGIALDWRRWSLANNYLFSDPSLHLAGYKEFSGVIRAIGFEDDSSFSPPATVLELLKYFPSAEKSYRFYSPQEFNLKSIGHFSFFKTKECWDEVMKFLDI